MSQDVVCIYRGRVVGKAFLHSRCKKILVHGRLMRRHFAKHYVLCLGRQVFLNYFRSASKNEELSESGKLLNPRFAELLGLQ